jgi:hypothetical protein
LYYLELNSIRIEKSEESMEMTFFRKRIQAINLKVMCNKIAYLIQIHRILKRRNGLKKKLHNHHEPETLSNKKHKKYSKWKSWSNKTESEIPQVNSNIRRISSI